MELYIVRHGETNLNHLKILQGKSNVSLLNEAGEAQGRLIGSHLKETKFDAVYTSDLARAVRTAELICEENQFKFEIFQDERLRERDYGDFEGHTWEEVRKTLKTDAQRSVVEAPPNGESLFHVRNRVTSFIEDIKAKYKGDEKVLLVTHHGTIMMLFVVLLELGLEHHRNFKFDNGSLSVFHIGDIYNKLIMANFKEY